MFIYVLVVYVWAWPIHPLGRDFVRLGDGGEDMAPAAQWLWQTEVSLFGGWAPGYLLVNMALMYACMVCLYFFINYTLRGPAWVGVLAANLFMANPMHAESMLNLSGVSDLLPCFVALAALACYAWHVETNRRIALWTTIALLILATIPFYINAWLPLVFLLYEGLMTGSHRRSRARLAVGFFGLIASLAWHGNALLAGPFNAADMFGPLYFTLYCIGFLPETAHAMYNQPLYGWSFAAIVAFALILIHRKVATPGIAFAVLAMLVLRLAPTGEFIDPVHLVGAGQLILPQALFMTGVAVIYVCAMDHPRWRLPLIYSSFTISVIFFILMVVTIFQWRGAYTYMREFQTAAQAETEENPGAPYTVVPDFATYNGAPLGLSLGITWDTAFSEAVANTALAPVHYHEDSMLELGGEEPSIHFTGATPEQLLPVELVWRTLMFGIECPGFESHVALHPQYDVTCPEDGVRITVPDWAMNGTVLSPKALVNPAK